MLIYYVITAILYFVVTYHILPLDAYHSIFNALIGLASPLILPIVANKLLDVLSHIKSTNLRRLKNGIAVSKHKYLSYVLFALLLCGALLACGVGHEHTWVDASCSKPRTCSFCGKTEGDVLGHDMAPATCTKPKTCKVCGATIGKPLSDTGHDWIPATCTEPETCKACGQIRGSALGHEWSKGSCIEPQKCFRCGVLGSYLDHIWVPATCTKPEVCSVCEAKRSPNSVPLGHKWTDATCAQPKTCTVCGIQEGEKLEHYSANHTTTVKPTCQSGGEATFTCDYCGEQCVEALPPIDHQAGEWKTVKKATSSSDGISKRYCVMCGTEMDSKQIEYSAPSSVGSGGGSSGSGGGSQSGNGNNFNTYDNEEQQQTTASYVLNTRTRKIHRPSCRDVPRISPNNYATTNRSKEDLISSGYSTCGHCHP